MCLIGPIENGREDKRIALVIVDKSTKFVKVIPIHRKANATNELFKWIDENTGFGHEVRHIHSDNGREFINYNFKQSAHIEE